MELIVDFTAAPIAAVVVDAEPLGSVYMDLLPLWLLEMNQGIYSQVEVPVFPEYMTQDFLTANGEFLTSDGEALNW